MTAPSLPPRDELELESFRLVEEGRACDLLAQRERGLLATWCEAERQEVYECSAALLDSSYDNPRPCSLFVEVKSIPPAA